MFSVLTPVSSHYAERIQIYLEWREYSENSSCVDLPKSLKHFSSCFSSVRDVLCERVS